ncbi:MAG TPA: alpha/beta hydrolase [Steroidobacteraceae bacterium]|nr:alpha/beta hydrolase [Steroidobacteraceae bacterium]
MLVTSAARNPATHPVDQYLKVADARLRYRDEGAGPAVILLHGWTLNLEMWDPQVARLRQEFRLIRVDRRGHGFSSGTPSPARDVSDVAVLCQHLGLTRVAVIGMSQGARAAVALASGAPERVDALILDGPPSFEPSHADEEVPLEHFRTVARTRGMPAFRREWLRHPLTQLRTADPQMRVHLIAMIERFAGNEFTDSLLESEVLPVPALPRSPALVLSGELDVPRRVRSADRLSVQLPGGERSVITGAGHLPNLDRPDEYSEMCRAFLNRHTRARRAP